MGYRSQVSLKTTTEGWILIKRLHDKIIPKENGPLSMMNVEKTPTGFYRISNSYIKWYDEYPNVENFNKALDMMTDWDIPFVFIEIGEDVDDIKIRNNWTDDMPDCLEEFDVNREINDPDDSAYKTIMEDGVDKEYKDLFTPPEILPESECDDTALVTDTLPPETEGVIDDSHIKSVMFDLIFNTKEGDKQ